MLRGRRSRATAPEWWREVPRLNFLPHRRRGLTRRQVFSLLLLAVIGLEVAGGQAVFRQRAVYLDHHAAVLRSFRGQQAALRDAQARLQEVQDRLTALRGERERLEALFRQATAGRADWGQVVGDLMGAQGGEVRLTRVLLEGGSLSFEGRADTLAAVQAFRRRLLASGALEVVELEATRVVPEAPEEGPAPPPYLQVKGILRPAREAP